VPLEGLTPGMVDTMQREAEQDALKRLSHAVLPHRIAYKRQHLSALPPVEAIPAIATETRCSIVVMGALSRTGIKRLLIGNTAEHVLDALACDVLVVKPGNFQSRIPKKSRGVPYVASTDIYPLSAF
jgi:universal stress protein E